MSQPVDVWVPTRGYPFWATVDRLNQICPYRFMPEAISVSYCRNLIVREFLRGDAEVLVMVDDDVVPPYELLEMVAEMGSHAVVGSIVLTASPGTVHAPNVYKRLSPVHWQRADWKAGDVSGNTIVDGIGAGCIAIRRATLEEMGGPFNFEIDGQGCVIVGEDLAFCERVRNRGGTIAARYDLFSEHHDDVYAGGLAAAYMEVLGGVIDDFATESGIPE